MKLWRIAEFLRHIWPRLEWKALKEAAETVSAAAPDGPLTPPLACLPTSPPLRWTAHALASLSTDAPSEGDWTAMTARMAYTR